MREEGGSAEARRGAEREIGGAYFGNFLSSKTVTRLPPMILVLVAGVYCVPKGAFMVSIGVFHWRSSSVASLCGRSQTRGTLRGCSHA